MESLTITLFMSFVHSLFEPIHFSLSTGILWYLFWRISTRYRSCIFHSRIFSAPGGIAMRNLALARAYNSNSLTESIFYCLL